MKCAILKPAPSVSLRLLFIAKTVAHMRTMAHPAPLLTPTPPDPSILMAPSSPLERADGAIEPDRQRGRIHHVASRVSLDTLVPPQVPDKPGPRTLTLGPLTSKLVDALNQCHGTRGSPLCRGWRRGLCGGTVPGMTMAPSIALARNIPGASTMNGAIDTSGGLPRAQPGTARWRPPAHHRADGHEPRGQYRANVDSYGTKHAWPASAVGDTAIFAVD
jgi:hypothetical protein